MVGETDKEAAVSKAIPVATSKRGREDVPADAREWASVLAEVPLFAGLSARHRHKLSTVARIRRFADGAPFIRAGEPGEVLFVLLDGEVSVRQPGRSALTLGIGSVIGELALLDGGARTATVVAKGPVVTLTITGRQFRKLLQSEPSIAIALAEELARRLRTAHATA
jgi:CRP/FNR family transcriptional regulator, cyclic AMP receptor protein